MGFWNSIIMTSIIMLSASVIVGPIIAAVFFTEILTITEGSLILIALATVGSVLKDVTK